MSLLRYFLMIFITLSMTSSLEAQSTLAKKDITGTWQLYRVEKADGSEESEILNPSYMYLELKPGSRIKGPIWTGDSYGHYWGRYRFKNGIMVVKRLVTYYPDFMGKNGREVDLYLSYLRAAYSCERQNDVLVTNFKGSKYGLKKGKLFFKSFDPTTVK